MKGWKLGSKFGAEADLLAVHTSSEQQYTALDSKWAGYFSVDFGF